MVRSLVAKFVVGASLSGSLVAGAIAGPLNRQWVDRDARWVVHVDVEAMAVSSIGPAMNWPGAGDPDQCVAEFFRESGFDLSTDIKGITIYGFAGDPHDAVAVILATPSFDRVVDYLVTHLPGFEKVADGPHPRYTWVEDGSKRYGQVMPGPDGLRLALVAREPSRLTAAAAVAGGVAPTLAGVQDGPLARQPAPGSFLFCAAHMDAPGDGRQASMLVQMTESLVVDVRDVAGEMHAALELTMREGRDPTAVVAMANGVLAWTRVMAGADPDLEKLALVLDGLEISTQARQVTARLSIPSSRVRELLNHAAILDRSSHPPAEAPGAADPDRKD